MGLVRGVLGAAGDAYGAVEGCRYMKGRLRAGVGADRGRMLTELGKVTEVVGWENLTAEMGDAMEWLVCRAHGVEAADARESIRGTGVAGRTRYVVVQHTLDRAGEGEVEDAVISEGA